MEPGGILATVGVILGPILTYLVARKTLKQSDKATKSDETAKIREQNVAEWQQLINNSATNAANAAADAATAKEEARLARADANALREENDTLKRIRSEFSERIELVERQMRRFRLSGNEIFTDVLHFLETLYRWADGDRKEEMPRVNEHTMDQLREGYPEEEKKADAV